MLLYTAIDLHSNNSMTVIVDEMNKVIKKARLPGQLKAMLRLLEPFRDDIVGVVAESTYNWYWLVDGLMDHGYVLHLANTVAIQQYEGLKHGDDESDARWLANLLRLGELPEGHIYPREDQVSVEASPKFSNLAGEIFGSRHY